MQDIVMRWKGNDSKAAVHGVNELDIPQFTIGAYDVGTTVESSLTVAAAAAAGKRSQRQPTADETIGLHSIHHHHFDMTTKRPLSWFCSSGFHGLNTTRQRASSTCKA